MMLRSRSFDLVNRRLEEEDQNENKKLPKLKGSYGADLYALEQDRLIRTEPEESSRRRTIRLQREQPQSWGFTLQTYGIRNKKTGEVEVMSYVDYIDMHGSAWMSGMRTGDIILSVNGESVENSTHSELVMKIQQCRYEMRLVVLFENCCRKVELHERYLRLKKVLAQKVRKLRDLEAEEMRLMKGFQVSRMAISRLSNGSSIASDWDIYSAVTSPTTLNGTPSNQFAFGGNKSQSELDISYDSSTIESNSLLNQWHSTASNEEISSFGADSHMSCDDDTKDFVHSYQSDVSEISETSDSGLRRLYNITRCAQRISDAGRCEGILAFDENESVSKNEGSMTNLVEDSGIDLKEVKVTGQGVVTSSDVSSSLLRKKKRSFFIESDSEDSILNNEGESHVSHDKNSLNENNSASVRVERLSGKESGIDNVTNESVDDVNLNVDVDSSDTSSSVLGDSKIEHGFISDTNYDKENIEDDEKLNEKSMKDNINAINQKNYIRDDTSTSSSSSKSSNDSSHKQLALGQLTEVTDLNEKRAFYQENMDSDESFGSSNHLSLHSKHKEYSVQGLSHRPSSSSSKRQIKSSEAIGATPVLISYKKDAEELDTKTQENVSHHRNETYTEDRCTMKGLGTVISQSERSIVVCTPEDVKQKCVVSSDGNTTTNNDALSTYSLPQEEVFRMKGNYRDEEGLSIVDSRAIKSVREDSSSTSSKSDSDPSLSSVSDSSYGDEVSSKLVQCDNNDNVHNRGSYSEENEGDESTSTSSSDSRINIPNISVSFVGSQSSTTTAITPGQSSHGLSNQSTRYFRGVLVNNQTQLTRL